MKLDSISAVPFKETKEDLKANEHKSIDRLGFFPSKNNSIAVVREIKGTDNLLDRLVSKILSLFSEKIIVKDQYGNNRIYLVNKNSIIKNLNIDEKAFKKSNEIGKAKLIESAISQILEANGSWIENKHYLFVSENRSSTLSGEGQLYEFIGDKPVLIAAGEFEDGLLKMGRVFEKTDKVTLPEKPFDKLVEQGILKEEEREYFPFYWIEGAVNNFHFHGPIKVMSGGENGVEKKEIASGNAYLYDKRQ